MSIDITQFKDWADMAKSVAETLIAIITATKAITAILRNIRRKRHANKQRKHRHKKR